MKSHPVQSILERVGRRFRTRGISLPKNISYVFPENPLKITGNLFVSYTFKVSDMPFDLEGVSIWS